MNVRHNSDPAFEQLQFFAQRHQPKRMPIAHWHSQIELNYLCHGRMTYLFNGQLVHLPEQRLGAFWGAVPHQVVAQEGESDLVVIYMPLSHFLSLNLPGRIHRRLMGGAFLVDRKADPVDPTLLPRWHRDLESNRQGLRDLVRSEIACRLQRLALTGYALLRSADVPAMPDKIGADGGIVDRRLEHVRRMTVMIASQFASRLTIDDIARAADLQPNYAMTLFRQAIGVTITDYLTRQRLSHAQSLLIDTGLPVATIAKRSGFGSLSRFYEVFRQWTGTTPTRYREDLSRTAEQLFAPASRRKAETIAIT